VINSLPGIVVLEPPDEVVGSEINIPLPANFIYKLICLQFTFDTDGNAATRLPQLSLTDGTQEIFRLSLAPTQMLNSIVVRSIAPMGALITAVDANRVNTPWPIDFLMKGTWEIDTVTTAIQVGDQYKDITLTVQRWATQNP